MELLYHFLSKSLYTDFFWAMGAEEAKADILHWNGTFDKSAPLFINIFKIILLCTFSGQSNEVTPECRGHLSACKGRERRRSVCTADIHSPDLSIRYKMKIHVCLNEVIQSTLGYATSLRQRGQGR